MKQLTVAVSSHSEADVLVEEFNKEIKSTFQMEITRRSPQLIELRFLESHPLIIAIRILGRRKWRDSSLLLL